MLRSSPRAVTLHVSPQGFAVSGSLRADKDYPPRLHPWPNAAGHADQNTAAAALTRLPLPTDKGLSALDVVLDNAWVRLQLVRFPHGIRSPEERHVYLKTSFRNVFGPEVDSWQIVSENNRLGLPSLAMAADSALLSSLRQLAERHKLRLRSMQSAFVTTFNRARAHLSARQGALAQIDAGRVCLGVWHQRSWVALRSQPITQADSAALGDLLKQTLLMAHPLPPGILYVVAHGEPSHWKPELPEGWGFTWLNNGF